MRTKSVPKGQYESRKAGKKEDDRGTRTSQTPVVDGGGGDGSSVENAKPGCEDSANGEGGADSGTIGADVGGDFDGSGAGGRYGGTLEGFIRDF